MEIQLVSYLLICWIVPGLTLDWRIGDGMTLDWQIGDGLTLDCRLGD